MRPLGYRWSWPPSGRLLKAGATDSIGSAVDMPRRVRLMLDDASGYLAAPRPGQLSRTLPSGPFPSLAPASRSFGSFQAGN